MKSTRNHNGHIKNVVLISFDSLRSDCITMSSSNDTPFFCLVRDKGASFKNAIAQVPFSEPSHFCMLTGLYPARTGFHGEQHQSGPDVPTIFSILKEEGFSTLASSKTVLLKSIGLRGIERHLPFGYKKLANAITRLNGKRFFACLHYCDIHTPYDVRLPGLKPKHILLNALKPMHRFTDRRFFRRALQYMRLKRVRAIRTAMKEGDSRIVPAIKQAYKGTIIKADKFVGDVLKLLEETRVSDETLLVLTGDHGDSFNEHNEIHRSAEDRYEHGQFLYDNIIKVPLIFYWPAKRFARVFDRQVRQIDIVPTILEALNISYDDLDGKSLWRAITGDTEELHRSFAFSEVVRERFGIERRCVRSDSHKLIRDYKSSTYELYDLSMNGEEKSNLWPGDDFPEKVELMGALERFYRIGEQAKDIGSWSEQEQRQIETPL